MALYFNPAATVYTYSNPPMGGKDPYISLNNNNFHANFAFFVGYYPGAVAPVTVRTGAWSSLPLQKQTIKLTEFSVIVNTYFNFDTDTGQVAFPVREDNPIVSYNKYISLGIGSQNCAAIVPPAVFDLTDFYGCNYTTHELFILEKQQYNRLSPSYVIETETQNNYLNCSITVSIISGIVSVMDLTNWYAQTIIDYQNYLAANPVLDAIYETYFVHINGLYLK